MKSSNKIYLGLTGTALIALGIICICNPGATLLSASTLIGLLTLLSGFTTLAAWSKVKFFLPTGNLLLSAILQIVVGLIFLGNKLFVAAALPVVFACWLLFEGIILAIRSFDFKAVHFGGWWVLFLLGVCAACLGFFSLRSPFEVGAPALSYIIGIGIILLGVIDLIALFGIKKLEKRTFSWIDEQ